MDEKRSSIDTCCFRFGVLFFFVGFFFLFFCFFSEMGFGWGAGKRRVLSFWLSLPPSAAKTLAFTNKQGLNIRKRKIPFHMVEETIQLSNSSKYGKFSHRTKVVQSCNCINLESLKPLSGF